MGKWIISRRRGKGSARYRAQGKLAVRLPHKTGKATVEDIYHVSARNTPIMRVAFEDGTTSELIAPENISTGDIIEFSGEAKPQTGNILPLNKIPEGTAVFCIEKSNGDGGKLCKSSGSFAVVKSHEKGYAHLQMPSRVLKKFDGACRAVVGKPAGAGRKAKPFLKASLMWRSKKARGKLWPVTSGSKMNPCDHPFGGKTGPGQSTSVSRNAPPGQKVGSIAPKRTGKRKRK
ncbi:MAG: 50S ribosomal protein L2 [Candidatus Aenigmarchaeota archaeon]|nr:50S ribosomal protein L2 [Candidatus Aenigmarchaeota archaeon]